MKRLEASKASTTGSYRAQNLTPVQCGLGPRKMVWPSPSLEENEKTGIGEKMLVGTSKWSNPAGLSVIRYASVKTRRDGRAGGTNDGLSKPEPGKRLRRKNGRWKGTYLCLTSTEWHDLASNAKLFHSLTQLIPTCVEHHTKHTNPDSQYSLVVKSAH